MYLCTAGDPDCPGLLGYTGLPVSTVILLYLKCCIRTDNTRVFLGDDGPGGPQDDKGH